MIVMTSFADKRKAFDRLYEVLKQIDSELEEVSDEAGRDAIWEYDTDSTLLETEMPFCLIQGFICRSRL